MATSNGTAPTTTTASKVQKIGWIGLGHAGYPLAANLPKAGFHLVVRDADPSRAEQFAKEHSHPNTVVAEDGPDAFKECDVLITMLPNGKVVREVLVGEDGVAAGLKDGEYGFF